MAIKFLHDIDLDDNQALNLVAELLSSNPAAEEGKLYYNTTTNVMMVCINSTWTALFPAKGDKGIQGIQGLQGLQGNTGSTGATGKAGTNGLNGITPTMTSLSGKTLPTSSRGLAAGKLWNNRGVVSIA
tara:strand:+ start:2655 stop:3041 length:387 start_codon:yes stop_codon:yes gene_type:complete